METLPPSRVDGALAATMYGLEVGVVLNSAKSFGVTADNRAIY